ncbi:hypothetical protein RUND412_009794 [Rhizina undulata]
MNDSSRGSPKLALPLLDIPSADTIVYLHPSPSPSPPLRVSSQKLLAADSDVLRKLLGPTEQFRILRRKKLLQTGLPFGIRFAIDLSPPSLEQDAVELVEQLWCPEEVLRWKSHIEGEYFEEDACGEEEKKDVLEDFVHEDTASEGEGGIMSSLGIGKSEDSQSRRTSLPPAYSASRHTAAIERILCILHDRPMQISSSTMWYTVYKTSLLLKVESKVADYLTSWLYGNIPFIEAYPGIVLDVAENMKSPALYRDAFTIIVYKDVYVKCEDQIPGGQGNPEEPQWGKNTRFAKNAFRERLTSIYSNVHSLEFLETEHVIPEYSKLTKAVSNKDSGTVLVDATKRFQEAIARVINQRLDSVGYNIMVNNDFYTSDHSQNAYWDLIEQPLYFEKYKWPYNRRYWGRLQHHMAKVGDLQQYSPLLNNLLFCKREWEKEYANFEHRKTRESQEVAGKEEGRMEILEVRGGDQGIVNNEAPSHRNNAETYPELQDCSLSLSTTKFQLPATLIQDGMASNAPSSIALTKPKDPPPYSAQAGYGNSASFPKPEELAGDIIDASLPTAGNRKRKSEQSLPSSTAELAEPEDDLVSEGTIFGDYTCFGELIARSTSSSKRQCSEERELMPGSREWETCKKFQLEVDVYETMLKNLDVDDGRAAASTSGPSWVEKGKYKAVQESPVLGAQQWPPLKDLELPESPIIKPQPLAESKIFCNANPLWYGFPEYIPKEENVWQGQAKDLDSNHNPGTSNITAFDWLPTLFDSYVDHQQSQYLSSTNTIQGDVKVGEDPAQSSFDLNALWSQIQRYTTSLATEILRPDPILSFETDIMDLQHFCFGAEEELKYLPIWAGGCDDGSGGVFGQFVEPERERVEVEDPDFSATADGGDAACWDDDCTDTATLAWTDAGAGNETGSERSKVLSLGSHADDDEWSDCGDAAVGDSKADEGEGIDGGSGGTSTEKSDGDDMGSEGAEWFDDESDGFEDVNWG